MQLSFIQVIDLLNYVHQREKYISYICFSSDHFMKRWLSIVTIISNGVASTRKSTQRVREESYLYLFIKNNEYVIAWLEINQIVFKNSNS